MMNLDSLAYYSHLDFGWVFSSEVFVFFSSYSYKMAVFISHKVDYLKTYEFWLFPSQ